MEQQVSFTTDELEFLLRALYQARSWRQHLGTRTPDVAHSVTRELQKAHDRARSADEQARSKGVAWQRG